MVVNKKANLHGWQPRFGNAPRQSGPRLSAMKTKRIHIEHPVNKRFKYQVGITFVKMPIYKRIKAVVNFAKAVLFDSKDANWAGEAELVDITKIPKEKFVK